MADAFARTATVPLWEVHPELSFALLLGGPAEPPQTTWAGQRERRAALFEAGIHLGDVGEVGAMAAPDDVLDAAARAAEAAAAPAPAAAPFGPAGRGGFAG